MAQTVFITGCSTGIGEATARLFASHGWQVAATMRNPADSRLAGLPTVRVYALDVTDEAAVERVIGQARQDFGGLDVVVNNAGYGVFGPFEPASTELIERQFQTNLFGAFAVIRHALPLLRAQQAGVIINITSVGGRAAFPLNSIYHATKFALDGFSESLQFELEPLGIQVKVVAPGGVATDFATRSLVQTTTDPDSPYRPMMDKVMAAFAARGGNYSTADQIAAVIWQAATDGRNQLRYVAGDDARQLLGTRAEQSEQAYHDMIVQGYGLNKM